MSALISPVGSAGRAHGSAYTEPRLVPVLTSDWNSYCLYCAHWFFGRYLSGCERCHEPIFRWVHSADLKHFRSRSSLEGF